MSDTVLVALIAALSAIVGGLASSIPTLWSQNRRWKVETKLEHLRSERRSKEELYRKTLEALRKGMAEDRYSHDMTTDMLVLMPKSIEERFLAWMSEKDKDVRKGNLSVMDISMQMKKSLAEIDKQIEDLLR